MTNPALRIANAGTLLLVAAAFGAATTSHAADERESPPIRQVQEIPLPDVQGRLDHFTLDLKRKRVIFSGLGNNSVQIVDAFAGRMIKSIPGLAQPQGTFYRQEGDKLYVANAADGHVNIYDGTKFNLLKRLEIGEDPDNLRYDAATKLLYVGYGDGAIGAIDTKTDTVVKTIELKVTGHPEGFQLETKGPRIFVNVADSKNIAVIDRNTGATTYWSLPAGHLANFPMVLDEDNRRVIIGTRRPSRVTVFDMDSGKIVASLPAAGDMDDIFYDSLRKRIYVSGGEGFISVFQQKDANTYEPMGKFATSIGTRTGVWYVKRDRLYLAAPPANGLGARILVFEPQD
jgi:DNA-binding beta-propeller fold protein YncE